jgi:Zn-finger nucleic acid-binding protein
MARNCPDCEISMETYEHAGVNVDVCTQCAGIWFDRGEARQIMAIDPAGLPHIDDKFVAESTLTKGETHLRMCPSCYFPLYKYHYLYNSPVELDGCEECGGFWVEDGELAKMQAWMVELGAPITTAGQKQVVYDREAGESGVGGPTTDKVRALMSVVQARTPTFIPKGE